MFKLLLADANDNNGHRAVKSTSTQESSVDKRKSFTSDGQSVLQ